MSALGLGQQRSEAIGPGSNICRVRYFYDFTEQNRDNPLLPINFFSIPEILWKTRVPLPSFSFRSCETQLFLTIPWCLPPPMHENFRNQIFFETQKGPLTKFFGTVRQKIFDKQSWYPLLVQQIFSKPQFFWNTELFPNKIFRYCGTKNFERKSWYPLFC